ncbi:MAG TPA: hypothetical protein VFU22_26890 [Roseiflexaceae bacterium]|nr:hypothetical protein [Roseiflexaceae bacterium]
MKTYRISPSGRRTALILLVGALIIWVFALWTFSSTLGISYNPIAFWGTLRASIEAGLSISQLVPALLMLVLIVATPLVIWNICEELSASYTPTADGLRFSAMGVALDLPWGGISSIRRVDEDSDEPMDELLLREDFTGQIRNSVTRFLHGQAYGRTKLPIYSGVADRDELLAVIRERAQLTEATGDAEQGIVDRERETEDKRQETGIEGATL